MKDLLGHEIVRALERCGVIASAAKPILVLDDDKAALELAMKRARFGLPHPVPARCQQRPASRVEKRPRRGCPSTVMPKVNGFEFLQRFRKMSRTRKIPVIVWTGKDLTDLERGQLRSVAALVFLQTRFPIYFKNTVRPIARGSWRITARGWVWSSAK